MNKVRNKVKKDFTIIPNGLINDDTLTDRARFLFCYMASKPEDWDFYQVPLSAALGYSVDTLRKYIMELLEAGWMEREEKRQGGQFDSFDYTLLPSPCGKNTDTVKNRVGKKPCRENSALSNKDVNKKRLNTKKERESAPSFPEQKTETPTGPAIPPPPCSAAPPPQAQDWVSCQAHLVASLEGEYASLLEGARQRTRFRGPIGPVAGDYCRNIEEGLITGKGLFHLRPPANPGEHRKWVSRMLSGIERYMSAAVRRENGTAPKISPPAPNRQSQPITRATAEAARKLSAK